MTLPILIVDDDADVRDAIRETLEYGGFAVVEATDGKSALTYLASEPAPALILLDWMMPAMDGATFCVHMAAEPRLAGIPVVVLTASHHSPEMKGVSQIRAVVRKPIDVSELLDTARVHARAEGNATVS